MDQASQQQRHEYQPTADEIEAAWAVMHDGAEMNGGAYRLTERTLIAAHDARVAELQRRAR